MNREMALSLAAAAASLVVLRASAAITTDRDGNAHDDGQRTAFFTKFTVLSPETASTNAGPSFVDSAQVAPNAARQVLSHALVLADTLTGLDHASSGEFAIDFADPVLANAVELIPTGNGLNRAYEPPEMARAVADRSAYAPAGTAGLPPQPLDDLASPGILLLVPAPLILIGLAGGLALPRLIRSH